MPPAIGHAIKTGEAGTGLWTGMLAAVSSRLFQPNIERAIGLTLRREAAARVLLDAVSVIVAGISEPS